jgi:peptidoglycan/LPS O-acetylase OafA/YrhL
MGNDSPKLGFGLWTHPVASTMLELVTLALGLVIYVALRSKRHPVRPVRLSILVLLLLGTYFASNYGPPPPDMITLGISVIAIVLIAGLLAAWADQRAAPEELQTRHLSNR